MPSKEAAPTKRVAVSVISDADAVAGQGRQSRQLERLVSGDPAADAKQDSGHPESAPRRAGR